MKKLLTFLAIAALMFACQKPTTPSGKTSDKTPSEEGGGDAGEGGEEGEGGATTTITIDGQFEDWVNFDQSKLFIAKNNADSPWPAVKEIRVYANQDFVFYYVKYDKESVEEQLAENDALHARICLDTDGEFESGYASYFLQPYDFIIEGSIGDGAGAYGDFGGTLSQRINGKWEALGGGMVIGAGAGTEYELMIDRAAFNEKAVTGSVPNQPIGDEFYTGMRFYCSGWEEFSNVPNSAVSQGDGSGWGNLLKIVTDK